VLRLVVDPAAPAPSDVERAARTIRRGGIGAFPTDTLYGLAADPCNGSAVARVFEAKGRAEGRPLPLVAADLDQVVAALGTLPPAAAVLARAFWPGPLTLLVGAPASLAAPVTAGTGRVGVRVPAHAVARALCRVSGCLLTATSANPSGGIPSEDPDEVERLIGGRIDFLLDAGRVPGGLPSTIVDTTGPDLVLVRAGAIPWERIERCRHANARPSSD
jgi:L-threonylcarbamoyladenylate synthase